MAMNMIYEFKKMINAVEWMDESSKLMALQKVPYQ